MNRQTFHARTDQVERRWLHVDATDLILGRISTRLARILMGKHKPEYTPHADVGDFVVVTNAEKIRLTGSKPDQKMFQSYSGYPGGLKQRSYRWMLGNRPEKLLQRSVRRMMPRSRLARQQISKLKIYRGPEHPHQAQQPDELAL